MPRFLRCFVLVALLLALPGLLHAAERVADPSLLPGVPGAEFDGLMLIDMVVAGSGTPLILIAIPSQVAEPGAALLVLTGLGLALLTRRAQAAAGSISSVARPPSTRCRCSTVSTSAVLSMRYQTPSG